MYNSTYLSSLLSIIVLDKHNFKKENIILYFIYYLFIKNEDVNLILYRY